MTTEGGAANGAASDPDARWHVGPTAQTGLLRYDQTFPTLTAAEIERLRRFGTVRSHPDGAYLFRAGTPSSGMLVVLSGSVAISNHDGLGHVLPMIEQGPGQFVGEIGQLSGARSVVDGRAEGATEVLLIAPDQIRALMVAEAELGERVMRALILRRVVLIESGVGGPVIIGSPTAFEVIRLQIFLGRNSQPYHVLDPATDAEAAQFVALHARSPGDLPLVVCPDGTVLRCPNRMELAHQLGMVGRLPTDRVYDVAIVGCGPAGLSTAVYAASEGLSVVVLDALAIGGQAGASARIENYFGFPTGISGLALTSRAYVQAQKFGAEILIPVVVESLDCIRADGYFGLAVDGGERIRSPPSTARPK